MELKYNREEGNLWKILITRLLCVVTSWMIKTRIIISSMATKANNFFRMTGEFLCQGWQDMYVGYIREEENREKNKIKIEATKTSNRCRPFPIKDGWSTTPKVSVTLVTKNNSLTYSTIFTCLNLSLLCHAAKIEQSTPWKHDTRIGELSIK